jgi:lysophospholipid acyltransferase (LPLAT)-like uncharacterized protein
MKLRSPWLLRLIGLLGAWLVRWWMGTLRYRVFFAGGERHPVDHCVRRCIYAFWHETILVPTIFRVRVRILISQHADGEMIAQACRFLGYQVVRGSTTRGGGPALLALQRHGRTAHLVVTPDGPRGPRRRVQLGLILLASLTGLPIVAFGVGYSRAWRAQSWDRFAVPMPWSTANCVVTPALHVPARLNREELEQYRRLVEDWLLAATAAAERWARGGPHPSTDPLWNAATRRQAVA